MMTKLVKLSRAAGHDSEDTKSSSSTIGNMSSSSDKNSANNNKKKDVLTFIKVQHNFETHKYVLNLRSLLAQVVLPALVKIPVEEVKYTILQINSIHYDCMYSI